MLIQNTGGVSTLTIRLCLYVASLIVGFCALAGYCVGSKTLTLKSHKNCPDGEVIEDPRQSRETQPQKGGDEKWNRRDPAL